MTRMAARIWSRWVTGWGRPSSCRWSRARTRACITAPTLVISGEDDPLIKVKGGRDTAARIPGARFVSYPGMGHNLPEELWPRIIDEIAAVTGCSRGSPPDPGV